MTRKKINIEFISTPHIRTVNKSILGSIQVEVEEVEVFK